MNELSDAQSKLAVDQMIGVRPKYVPGKYGRKYDYHKCGHCGRTVMITDNYCACCGFRLLWDSPRCLTDMKNFNEHEAAKEDVATEDGEDNTQQGVHGVSLGT